MPVKDILEISFIIHLQKHINTHKNTSADKKNQCTPKKRNKNSMHQRVTSTYSAKSPASLISVVPSSVYTFRRYGGKR